MDGFPVEAPSCLLSAACARDKAAGVICLCCVLDSTKLTDGEPADQLPCDEQKLCSTCYLIFEPVCLLPMLGMPLLL
jgi:hypothetical protein